MSPRVRTVVTSAATVVILALVIVGLWAFTAPKSQPVPPTIQLSAAQQSQDAYDQGIKALSNEQTDTAIAQFKKAIALDPTNTAAKTSLAQAQSSSSSSSNSSKSSTSGSTTTKPKTTTPAAPSAWLKSIALGKLVPTSFAGYGVGPASSGAPDVIEVSATALKANMPVQSVAWYVYDMKTNAKALAFIKNTSKAAYPGNPATLPVDDVTGYFGTASGGQATLAFVRGRYVFEVITGATPGTSIAAQQALAQQAGSAFTSQP